MEINKILVIRNDRIGDLVFASCVFRELRKKYPNARIVAGVSKSNKALVEKNPDIDKTIVADFGRDFLKNFKKNLPALREIKKENFDVGIDLRGDIITAFFLMFSTGIKYRIGFNRGLWAKILYNYTQKRDTTKHECFNMLDIVNKGLGLDFKNYMPEIKVSEEDKEEADKFISKNKLKKFICISPEAKSDLRQWPLEDFDKIIKHLRKVHPKQKIILVGIDEDKINWLAERNPGVIKLIKANLRMVYVLFQKSSLVVSLDTGTTHIAWPGNSKLITIFMKVGELALEHTKPLGENSVGIVGGGKKVEPWKVIEAIERFL